MDIRNQQTKRKIQNRDAQRRFRSRRGKVNEVALIHLGSMDESSDQISEQLLTCPSSSLGPLPDNAQLQVQDFDDSTDISTLLTDQSYDESLLNICAASYSSAWLESPAVPLSTRDKDPCVVRKNDFLVPGCQAAQAGPLQKSPMFSDSACCVKTPTENTGPHRAANSTFETKRSSKEVQSRAKRHHAPKMKGKLSVENENESSGCCVAHKAATMVTNLQELYTFGLRFGLLSTGDDDIEDSLDFLKERFGEMSQCSNSNDS
ncbi:hypothetical protein K431DRAFT_316874 [Polychaeton citri CBS 116435]|uniref:BZIP domain-containing protein n=1 Tax=Polychaeton citri CBS 116435 TaxID=1314669 RepID=A0A9P4Q0R7_9PEZI|nr:hypothetical protein K431DRAFT_316874 [Polychaeton citri CBS 116435]